MIYFSKIKIFIFILPISLLSCNQRKPIDNLGLTYHKIACAIVDDQLSSNHSIVILEEKDKSDSIIHREFRLFEYPLSGFIYDTNELTISVEPDGPSFSFLEASMEFPSLECVKDYSKLDHIGILQKWDEEQIQGCELLRDADSIFFDQRSILLLGIDYSKEDDLLFISYPILNTQRDSAFVSTTMFVNNFELVRLVSLAKEMDEWQIFDKLLFVYEVRESITRIDENRTKETVALVIRGHFEEF